MNKKAIKYMATYLLVIGCLSTIPNTALADTVSYSVNDLESSTSYTHNDKSKNEKNDKHNGFNVFSEENSKYLSSDQKKNLLELKECKNKGDKLSTEQEETLHSIIDSIVKGKLGDEKYQDFKCLIKKKNANETLTEEENKKLEGYKAIVNKPSTKDIINQFLR